MAIVLLEHMHILLKYFISTGPSSLLDIGLSFGKMGFIDRNFLDSSSYNHSGNSADKTIIDGMATFTEYKNDPQKAIYDNIYTGNAFEIIDKMGTYEMIVLGDVLEHLEKRQAYKPSSYSKRLSPNSNKGYRRRDSISNTYFQYSP